MSFSENPVMIATDEKTSPTTSNDTESATSTYELDDQSLDFGRRTFIKALVGVFAAAWAVVAVYPVLRYLWPKAEVVEVVNELVLGKLSDFPPGSAKNFKFGSLPALFIHTPDGKLQAFNAKCTHLGCTVQYQADANNIYCACHGGIYDAHTGKNVSGPPPGPLATLVAQVVNDEIVIKRA
jgi:cytochrome b6-f complex iron-sulfur subunit